MTLSDAAEWMHAWARAGRFALVAAAAGFSRSTYTAEMRTVLLRQMYFTAWEVAVGFTLFASFLSLVVVEITINAARVYGLAPYALELVFRVLVLEILPFGTALFIAIRSGSALSTEVALMHSTGELDRLHAAGVDPFEREFVPRVVAAALSVLALTVLSCGMAMVVAYVGMYGFSPWGFGEYTHNVARVFSEPTLAGLALKCIVFGVVVAVIPIAAGLDATSNLKSAPLAVMGGMVRLILALALLEVLSLAVKYV
jgi:phospholipid/cholesterol/gamma-HCH transport system permease protein